MLSIAPFLAVQQCIYDVLKNGAAKSSLGNNVTTFLACGAFAGTLAQTVCRNRLSPSMQWPVTYGPESSMGFAILGLNDKGSYNINLGFDSLDGGDSVEVTMLAAIVVVIVLFAGVSAVWRYRPCWPKCPL